MTSIDVGGGFVRVLGIEFAGSHMNYVILDKTEGVTSVASSSRLSIGNTRPRTALVAFQSAVTTLINETAPDRVAIKAKPEVGNLRAGAASLKMEGIVLANCGCDVDFVSGKRVNNAEAVPNTMYEYLQPALRAAVAAME